jgi:hypothetical protein
MSIIISITVVALCHAFLYSLSYNNGWIRCQQVNMQHTMPKEHLLPLHLPYFKLRIAFAKNITLICAFGHDNKAWNTSKSSIPSFHLSGTNIFSSL